MSHQVIDLDQIPKNPSGRPVSPNTKTYDELIAAVDALEVGKAIEVDLNAFPNPPRAEAVVSNMRTRWNSMGRPKHLYRCVRRKVADGEHRIFVFRLEEDSLSEDG